MEWVCEERWRGAHGYASTAERVGMDVQRQIPVQTLNGTDANANVGVYANAQSVLDVDAQTRVWRIGRVM